MVERSFEVEVCNEIAAKSPSPFAFRNIQNETPQFKFHASATRFPPPLNLYTLSLFFFSANKIPQSLSFYLFLPHSIHSQIIFYICPDRTCLTTSCNLILPMLTLSHLDATFLTNHKFNSYENQHRST